MARRALLTEGEREALKNPESRDNPYVAVSRVRKKIENEFPKDVEILQQHADEHGSDLLDSLRDIVCEDPDGDQMPICKDCGYEVMESSDDRGDYFCRECNAILQEKDVRHPQTATKNDMTESGSSVDAVEPVTNDRQSDIEAKRETYGELEAAEETRDESLETDGENGE